MKDAESESGSSSSPNKQNPSPVRSRGLTGVSPAKMPARLFYAGSAFILIFCFAQTIWSFCSIRLFNLIVYGGGVADPEALTTVINVRMRAEYITKIAFGLGALCLATALMAQLKGLLSLEQIKTPSPLPKRLIKTGIALICIYCISQSIWFWRDIKLEESILTWGSYPDPVEAANNLRLIAIARYTSSLSLGVGLLCLAFASCRVLRAMATDR